jgi:hypothetical protein
MIPSVVFSDLTIYGQESSYQVQFDDFSLQNYSKFVVSDSLATLKIGNSAAFTAIIRNFAPQFEKTEKQNCKIVNRKLSNSN